MKLIAVFKAAFMINPEILANIEQALGAIEQKEGVRVPYACESGSRAWGFASSDSDYDVRFIYVHSRDHYLSVFSARDVIEQKIANDLDVSGWDLRKTLGLLSKSNPPLLEWFKSPIVYRQDADFVAAFRSLMDQFYSPKRCFAHYLHMGAGNWRRYIEGREIVSQKKYLYVFRPILACRWIERLPAQPPILFSELITTVLEENDVRAELEQLLARKRAGKELGEEPQQIILSRFLAGEILRLEAVTETEEREVDPELLNQFFRQVLNAHIKLVFASNWRSGSGHGPLSSELS